MDCENVDTLLEVQSIERSSNFEWLATAPEMKVAQIRTLRRESGAESAVRESSTTGAG